MHSVGCTWCEWMSCYWYVFPCHGHNADSASPPDGFAIKSGFSEFAKWISRTLLDVESTFLKIHIFAQPSIFVPFKESAKPAQRVQDPQLDVPDSAPLKKTWTKYFPYFVNFLFCHILLRLFCNNIKFKYRSRVERKSKISRNPIHTK